jgi:hypothetical protein
VAGLFFRAGATCGGDGAAGGGVGARGGGVGALGGGVGDRGDAAVSCTPSSSPAAL